MDETLRLDISAHHMRRVFGMLTGYVLLPDSNHGFTEEFLELDLTERVSTLVAGRALWHVIAADAVRAGAYDGVLEHALSTSKHFADLDFELLPGALSLAQELDETLTRSAAVISTVLVAQIATDASRTLGSLAYFLRAARIVLHRNALDRGVSVDVLLAALGQALAQD